jgi:hypothetical protein
LDLLALLVLKLASDDKLVERRLVRQVVKLADLAGALGAKAQGGGRISQAGNIGIAQDIAAADGGVWTLRADVINVTDTVTQLRDGSGIGVGAPQYLARRGFFVGLSRRL